MPAMDPLSATANGYAVPATPVETETVVKKSRFIARVAFASDREQALQSLTQARSDYPDARHHCWAYLLGSPKAPRSQACSDDGEPSGTAGKPILNVVQHKDVGDLMLIVIRYFGGIKLGAGGLVRAYSQAAQSAMEQLSCCQFVQQQAIRVRCGFAQEQSLRHWFAIHEGSVTGVEYAEVVSLQASIPVSRLVQWRAEAARLGLSYETLDASV